MSGPTQLYRAYDHAGALLYVGISLNALNRMAQHGTGAAPWFPSMARLEMQAFASRKEAEAAERAAISSERPKHNVCHNYGPPLPSNRDLNEPMTATEFRTRLKALGIRQSWLAERLGVNTSTVNRWATGKVEVAPYVAFILDLLEMIETAKIK